MRAIYILEYLQLRERCGEKLGEKSPLIRDEFIIDDLLHIENPKHLTVNTLNYYLRNILIKVGIRKVIPLTESGSKKKERKNVAQNHGFRKFCHTTMANKLINPEIREMLLGHSIGLSDFYYRPSESQLLGEYLKVVDDLTINEENRLKRENENLREQDDYQKYIIDKKINDLTSRLNQYEEIEREKRIMSKAHAQHFADIYEKVNALMDQRKEERKRSEKRITK